MHKKHLDDNKKQTVVDRHKSNRLCESKQYVPSLHLFLHKFGHCHMRGCCNQHFRRMADRLLLVDHRFLQYKCLVQDSTHHCWQSKTRQRKLSKTMNSDDPLNTMRLKRVTSKTLPLRYHHKHRRNRNIQYNLRLCRIYFPLHLK